MQVLIDLIEVLVVKKIDFFRSKIFLVTFRTKQDAIKKETETY